MNILNYWIRITSEICCLSFRPHHFYNFILTKLPLSMFATTALFQLIQCSAIFSAIFVFPPFNTSSNIELFRVDRKKLNPSSRCCTKPSKMKMKEKVRISDSHDHLLKSNGWDCTSRKKSSHKTFEIFFSKKIFFLVTSDD